MGRFVVVVAAVFGSSLLAANAQHTEAQCISGLADWSFNSLNPPQSPCLVAAYLGSTCSSTGDYDVPSIGPGFHYNPSQIPSKCECNTVTYSLYSACAYCQNATISPFDDFLTNCTSATRDNVDGNYPYDIHVGTAVPAWAYQQVMGTNRFDINLAQSTGDQPESAPPARSSTARSTSGSQTGSSSGAAPAQSSGGSSSGGKKSNVGAIVGGVVGGLLVLGAIGALIAFCLIRKRRRNRATPSAAPMGMDHEKNYGYDQPSVIGSPPPNGESPFNPPLSTRPYDPNDPSTFPPSRASHMPTTATSMTASSNQPLGYNPHQQHDATMVY